MDRTGGWEDGDAQKKWVGARFAASMWIHTKAVVRNGQNHMQNFGIFNLKSILKAANWVCDVAHDDRVWVSEQTIALQEAKASEAL